jgi:2,3,4,5-tetrahydropyridine-2-carboxylate N-succinyltransferase
MNKDIIVTIETAFDEISGLTPQNISASLLAAIRATLKALNEGSLRVAEKIDGQWVVNTWVKKAILLYFRSHHNHVVDAGYTQFYDKIPLKYENATEASLSAGGVRVVPGALARYGAYIAANTVLMPSYVNIGAYIDTGCMIDTWATVGSCVQMGKNVHLSGGAGLGGVLEPLQANPTIIEDQCFIGARSEIVEGVIVGEGAVISMGVFIGASTKIYNRMTGEITQGYVPPGSVVVAGSLPSADGKYALNCAVIVKEVDKQTRSKVSVNEILRGVS